MGLIKWGGGFEPSSLIDVCAYGICVNKLVVRVVKLVFLSIQIAAMVQYSVLMIIVCSWHFGLEYATNGVKNR